MLASHYIREEFMITGLDHLGIVAPDLSTASDVLLGQFGFCLLYTSDAADE